MLGALGLYAAWHAPHISSRLAWWLVGGCGLLFALYSYLFSAFIMPAAGLSLLLLYWVKPSRARLLEGLLTLSLVSLLFLPLANNAWGVNAAESSPGRAFENFWVNHTHLLQVLTVWRVSWPAALLQAGLGLWGLLLLTGLLPIRLRPLFPPNGLPLDALWLWLWLGTPLLVANLLLSRSGSIFDEDRYLIFLGPFALWAVTRGILLLARFSRGTGAVLAAATLLTLILALPQIWSPANYRENWRAAAQYIIDYTRATPALSAAGVVHVGYTNVALHWYLRQIYSFEELPVFHPFEGWVDPTQVEEAVAPPLRGIEELGVDTLWLVQSHVENVDSSRVVEGWLQETYPIVTEQYPAGIKLTGHMLHYRYAMLPVKATQPIQAGPHLRLHHCEATFDPVAAQDIDYHPPSGWVHVQSWWSAESSTTEEYVLTAQVIGDSTDNGADNNGAVWGESLSRPADTFRHTPTSTWSPGEFMRAELDINLNPQTPPGIYRIELRLQPAQSAETYTLPCDSVTIQ
jgi:hypothetical protein